MIRAAIIAAAVLLLAGCWQSETRAAYRVSGQVAGQAVDATIQGGSASDAGVDPVAAITGVVAALRGDVAQVAAAVKAQPPPQPPVPAREIAAAVIQAQPPAPPPTDNTAIYATGGTALAGLFAAFLQARKAAADHKADADAAWDRLAPPPKV